MATMGRVRGVSPSGDAAWAQRPATARATMDATRSPGIRAIPTRSRGTYGARRGHAARIARLLRPMGWAGVSRRRVSVR